MHKIVLLKTHTHANRAYFAGHVIEVDDHTARWLIERGVGRLADAASPPQEDAAAGTAPETKPQRKAKE
jgi:hypothetical protein